MPSILSFVDRVRDASALALHLAIDQVQTLAGALAILTAEREGRARPEVLRVVDKRVAELRGEAAPAQSVQLVTPGLAVDPDMRAWERQTGRIVEAVGHGRWARRV